MRPKGKHVSSNIALRHEGGNRPLHELGRGGSREESTRVVQAPFSPGDVTNSSLAPGLQQLAINIIVNIDF